MKYKNIVKGGWEGINRSIDVVESCKTLEQLEIADKYWTLAAFRVRLPVGSYLWKEHQKQLLRKKQEIKYKMVLDWNTEIFSVEGENMKKYYRTWTTVMAMVEADSFEEAEEKSLKAITSDNTIKVESLIVGAVDEV